VASDARTLGLALARDPAGARAALLAGASGAPPRHNLRRAATSFVGRDTERFELARALSEPDRRLVTLVGPGGIGKTRLALQLAADLRDRDAFAGGTWFVPLEHATEPEVPHAIAEALGAPCPDGVDADAHLTRVIGASATLLVLDNLEHLTGVAPRVARWLAACPGLTVLATGRQPLELASEWVVPVAGLGVPPDATADEDPRAWPAVALFEARGRQVDPTFRVVPDNASHVASLVRLTGGSPLALELAAAWVASMAPAAIAAEVARDADFLRTTQHDRVDRHRSLRAVFEHSWRLLTPADRVHLAALAVFRGGIDRAGARAVAGADAAALARLAARSLLVRAEDDRFDLHPLLRRYVEEKLDADPAVAAATRARHVAHLLQVAEAAVPHLGREGTAEPLERLEADHANLRAALTWADAAGERGTLLRLVTALVEFWTWRGHHREALDWFARAAAQGPDPDDPGAFARAQLRFAFLCFGQRRFEVAAPLVGAALERFRTLGDVAGEARARSHLGMLAVFQGDFAAARPHYHQALALARAAGDDDLIGRVLNNLGDAHAYELDAATAIGFYEEALTVVQRLGDGQMASNVLGSLGLAALAAGDRARAQAAIAEGAAIARTLGITYALPTALDQLACLAADDGDGARAAHLWGTASGLRAALEVPEPEITAAQLAPFRAAARGQVGARAFDAAWGAAQAQPRPRLLSAFDAELAAATTARRA
jgi:predicted ATPase